MKLWAGRFQKETDALVNDFNSSISFDARMYREDITGSIAHAAMLGRQGIIKEHEAEKIIDGLKAILADIEAGQVEFSLENEDTTSAPATPPCWKRAGAATSFCGRIYCWIRWNRSFRRRSNRPWI